MDHGLESASALQAGELAGVLDAMREGLQVIDRAWRYVYVNAAAARHGRVTPGDLVGRTMMECYPGIDQTPLFDTLRDCMERGIEGALENEFRYPDGTSRIFQLRIQTCSAGVVVLSIDVTDERKLETQFRHAQKMEAIGRLAGSVAHDFNNLLSVILSYSVLMLEDLEPTSPMCQDLEAIKRAGERAADLTRQLLAFSRQQVLAPRLVDLNDVIRESNRMLRRLLGEDVELISHLEPGLPKVKVDPGQIDQVVMNLALNARDAMPQGGKLTIETKLVELEEGYVGMHLGVSPGAHVMLAVSDTGQGMSQEVQSRLFEPFFTTKPVGKGTGLGLSTVFGIVKQSGGNIWVYSEPGMGTTFKIYLPRADKALVPHIELVPKALSGTETILLTEDQEAVRDVARQILGRFGYHVLVATDAKHALYLAEHHPEAIDLLVTDVVMPQMNGRELAQRVGAARPGIKVLFMSGYTDNSIVEHALLDSPMAYIQKPLVPEAFAQKVRATLDALSLVPEVSSEAAIA
jgi:signal transduction histidine kinase/CheY-like chemotaxis protein